MENKFMTSLIKGSNSALAGWGVPGLTAQLAEWTARKVQWRKERAEGKAAEVLKPQQNDRPEVTGKAAAGI